MISLNLTQKAMRSLHWFLRRYMTGVKYLKEMTFMEHEIMQKGEMGMQISSSIITELLRLLSRCQDDQQMVRPGIKVQAKGCSVKVEHLYSDDSYINNFSLVSPLSCRQIRLASFVIFSPDRFKDFFNSHSATDCFPAPQLGLSPIVSYLNGPHHHPSSYTGRKLGRQSEHFSLLHMPHPN